MSEETLTWHKIEQWIDQLIKLEVAKMANAIADQRLYWAQGRLQAFQLLKTAPQAITAMEAMSRERQSEARTARLEWEPGMFQSGDDERSAVGEPSRGGS